MTALPVADEEQTYWVDHDLVIALRGSRVVWRRRLGQDVVRGLGLGASSLLAVRKDGLLCAMSRRAGVLLWRTPLGEGAASFCTVPQSISGMVLVVLGDRGTVWAVEE